LVSEQTNSSYRELVVGIPSDRNTSGCLVGKSYHSSSKRSIKTSPHRWCNVFCNRSSPNIARVDARDFIDRKCIRRRDKNSSFRLSSVVVRKPEVVDVSTDEACSPRSDFNTRGLIPNTLSVRLIGPLQAVVRRTPGPCIWRTRSQRTTKSLPKTTATMKLHRDTPPTAEQRLQRPRNNVRGRKWTTAAETIKLSTLNVCLS